MSSWLLHLRLLAVRADPRRVDRDTHVGRSQFGRPSPCNDSLGEPVLTLPSGGDCSYPGLVWNEDLLWMSYYSSHDGKTSIYLARIRFDE